MSALLDSLLDDERRFKCRVNDGAMAMGRPIIASLPTTHAVRCNGSLNHHAMPEQSELFDVPEFATGELG